MVLILRYVSELVGVLFFFSYLIPCLSEEVWDDHQDLELIRNSRSIIFRKQFLFGFCNFHLDSFTIILGNIKYIHFV